MAYIPGTAIFVFQVGGRCPPQLMNTKVGGAIIFTDLISNLICLKISLFIE